MNPERDQPSSRRQFLAQATALTSGLASIGAARDALAAPPPVLDVAPSLPMVSIGRHKVTRLILGGNPIYGYSHFNRLYDEHLRRYHTPERVVELVRAASQAGIRTWQNSWDPRTVDDVRRCREAGIEFNWLLLGKPTWENEPSMIETAAKEKPIGIAPHGALAERLHRAGKVDILRDHLKRIRDTGCLVGLSAHNPGLIDLSEEKGWDVDYYMTCLYYLTRPQDETLRKLGERPLGEVYLPSDRERMFRSIAAANKPCLAYKILAAGRADLSPAGVHRTFEETLKAIKKTDAMIVGMFQEMGDQVAMNAGVVRELMKA